MYEIEKNVPLPPDPRGRPSKYPFSEMKPGDSIFVASKAAAARRASYLFGVRHGLEFATRKEGDGVRIWRIK